MGAMNRVRRQVSLAQWADVASRTQVDGAAPLTPVHPPSSGKGSNAFTLPIACELQCRLATCEEYP